jgi:hypothetical protein
MYDNTEAHPDIQPIAVTDDKKRLLSEEPEGSGKQAQKRRKTISLPSGIIEISEEDSDD